MKMYCTPLLCADSAHLGRLNYESLSQQALMEIVVEGVTNKNVMQDANGNYKDVCLWDGITCNGKEEVISIGGHDNPFDYNGKLNFDFLPMSIEMVHLFDDLDFSINVDLTKLPPNMLMFSVDHCTPQQINVSKLSRDFRVFHVTDSDLTGTLPTDELPSGLRIFGLRGNHLFGTVNLDLLPSTMEMLDLQTNEFTGTLSMSSLPRGLSELDLGRNQFHGSIDLSKLPGGIEMIGIDENKFAGTIDLSNFPETISHVELGENSFEGSIRLLDFPISMSTVRLYENNLSGEVAFRGLTHTLLIELQLEKNRFCGSVDLTELPQGLEKLDISYNKFSGTVDLSRLPGNMELLDLSDNELSGEVFIDAELFHNVKVENTKLNKQILERG